MRAADIGLDVAPARRARDLLSAAQAVGQQVLRGPRAAYAREAAIAFLGDSDTGLSIVDGAVIKYLGVRGRDMQERYQAAAQVGDVSFGGCQLHVSFVAIESVTGAHIIDAAVAATEDGINPGLIVMRDIRARHEAGLRQGLATGEVNLFRHAGNEPVRATVFCDRSEFAGAPEGSLQELRALAPIDTPTSDNH